MSTRRLTLALELLRPTDWEMFERLASTFLASDFAELRTTASPSGDEGRDAELFSPRDEPGVLLQYSVAVDWADKINRTVRRLQTTFPDSRLLVYVTNQTIGALADQLKMRLRTEYGLALDVRDSSWFMERAFASRANEIAGEQLTRVIVDPYLASTGITSCPPSELSSSEAIAALTFLGLQWQDDLRDKGLTKIVFEALVRSVLRDSDSDHRLHRSAIQESIRRLLPAHDASIIDRYTDGALRRLTKRAIRHWQSEDEFCLTHEESTRVDDFKTTAALAQNKLDSVIHRLGTAILEANEVPKEHAAIFLPAIRAATEAVLFQHSQAFAMAVAEGSLGSMLTSDASAPLITELSRRSFPKLEGIDWLSLLRTAVREVLLSDDPAVQEYMRSLADAFTLLAFLQQTPDVQGAVEKMFSHGKIWLDTSVVLPLLAEPLDEEREGRFTRMIQCALEAGLELYVTPGVIEEIERHMNRSLTCVRMGYADWQGSIPYLTEQYVASGRPPSTFVGWLETFRGTIQPENDISQYLSEELGIATKSLEAERDAAPSALRYALQTIWYEAHQRRRNPKGQTVDEMAITRLVEHDVECYCGVTHLRTSQRPSSFGYTVWWLTIDRVAFNLEPRLREAMGDEVPDSPLLSADFMVNYLAFGPVRRRISKLTEANLPLILELGTTARYLTQDIMLDADRIREELKDLPERVIRRRVRDLLDLARRRHGPISWAGVRALDDDVIA